MAALVPVFADQLSHDLSALRSLDKGEATVLMMEVAEEANAVWHHRRKLVFLFSAMRHFAGELGKSGWQVRYVALDDEENAGSFDGEVERAIAELEPDRIVLTEPGEWRVEQMALAWQDRFGLPVEIRPDDRFLAGRDEFAEWAEGRKQLRMEYFYREMRRKTGLLMEDGEPAGGQWNFDKENRRPARDDLFMPDLPSFKPDKTTSQVIDMVSQRFEDRFGDLDGFDYAVTAADAERAADDFIENRLELFGDFQDAMLEGEDHLYHSVLSPYINAGLLDPLALCRRAEAAWKTGEAPINAVEGFIRQIIGWREYVRGIYWLKMPGYLECNVLDADRDLPQFYWTGETRMNCMAQAIGQTRRLAYAHHIQRLMVTGTFALLAGIKPQQVHEWYLAVYIDAFEWVEAPNTLGMSQYADGGLLGSKPYAASGAYIDRMSDYCRSCNYDVKQRTGDDACPFNALYWDFLARNESKLKSNRRMAMMYRNLERMDKETREGLGERAQDVLSRMEQGEL